MQFSMLDFKVPVGERPFALASHFERILPIDNTANPRHEEISGEEEYRAEEDERIARFESGELCYYGV